MPKIPGGDKRPYKRKDSGKPQGKGRKPDIAPTSKVGKRIAAERKLGRESNPPKGKRFPTVEERDSADTDTKQGFDGKLSHNPNADLDSSPRGRGDSGKMLLDPHRQRSDTQLLNQAITKGWNVRRKTMIRRRVENILLKKTGEVNTKDGLVDSETKADELALVAANILIKMDSKDLDRQAQFADPKTAPKTEVNVNVSVEQHTAVDSKRLQLIELANRFGARELVVDGSIIQQGGHIKSTS